jgi:hypothetical protein
LRPAQENSSQDPISKITRAKWTAGVPQVVDTKEHLFCNCEALSSTKFLPKKQKKLWGLQKVEPSGKLSLTPPSSDPGFLSCNVTSPFCTDTHPDVIYPVPQPKLKRYWCLAIESSKRCTKETSFIYNVTSFSYNVIVTENELMQSSLIPRWLPTWQPKGAKQNKMSHSTTGHPEVHVALCQFSVWANLLTNRHPPPSHPPNP